jgi:hypothetical protein
MFDLSLWLSTSRLLSTAIAMAHSRAAGGRAEHAHPQLACHTRRLCLPGCTITSCMREHSVRMTAMRRAGTRALVGSQTSQAEQHLEMPWKPRLLS